MLPVRRGCPRELVAESVIAFQRVPALLLGRRFPPAGQSLPVIDNTPVDARSDWTPCTAVTPPS